PRVHEPVFEFEFGSLAMSFDGAQTQVSDEALVAEPELAFEEPATLRTARRPKRRLATTLVFATLFFSGAAFSAGAGDVVVQALESDAPAAGEVTSTEEETTTAVEESAPAEEPSASESGEASPASDGELAEEPASVEEPAPGGEPTAAEEPGADDAPGEAPVAESAQQVDEAAEPAGGGSGAPAASPDGNGAAAPDAPAGAPLFVPPAVSPSVSAALDPEVDELGSAATIWLHRTLPDPTPPARRLAPGFAQMLSNQARAGRVDWALVLGVLRARGEDGRRPASRSEVRALVRQLVKLGARNNEWAAVLALEGRTAFADRSIALARYDRAVGLRALVTGLQAAKPALQQKVLADSRIDVYGAGRSDIASGGIDVRVLVVLRYLAEAHGQVSVSSLHSGHRTFSRPGVVSAHIYGLAVDISALGGTSVAGHQEAGSVTERAVRDLLLLPAEVQPRQVISLIGMGGPSFPMADHDDHVHIGF
ncbi:MAG: hypothetical protein ACR2L0_04960, partial [Gaiellaceae bacterium]